jgi:hypothetical protein
VSNLILAAVALAAVVTALWPRGSPRARGDPPERISPRSLRRLRDDDRPDSMEKTEGGSPS